ncbi:hypothetical protein E0H86_07340 [Acinetobacter sp. ANC 4635]|uniref:hypothetical protein n=1 Tax=Acinetobacter sp. ANC 4635 TaxID=2529846 RepID=UPI00103D983B|nr:hypothetical protein [Acinetobacter sp. ANC 4635]TCB32220.1 hypothetical protein E0H86_07340 [Acinetobacter sp. ANC 4635]
MDIQKQREAFESYAQKFFKTDKAFEKKGNQYIYDEVVMMWDCWITKQLEIDELKAKLEKLESGNHVLIKKSEIGDYYYDESEGIYIDEPDNFLTHLEAGEVQEVQCRGYFDLPSQYAARTWDEENQDVDTWKFFKSKEEAEKAAVYCEAKFAAQGEGHE